MKQAVLYLIGRILLLLAFLAAIIIAPYAAVFIIPLYYLCVSITGAIGSLTGKGSSGYQFLAALFFFFFAFFIFDKLMKWVWYDLFVIVVVCIVVIGAGVQVKSFIYTERKKYYINSKVDKYTAYYPSLLIASGTVRFAMEFFVFMFKMGAKFLPLVSAVSYVLFALALVAYIVRTIHIFKENK